MSPLESATASPPTRLMPVAVVAASQVLAAAPGLARLGRDHPGRVRAGTFSFDEERLGARTALQHAAAFLAGAPAGVERPGIVAVLARSRLEEGPELAALPFRLMAELRFVNVLAIGFGRDALFGLARLAPAVITAVSATPADIERWLARTVAAAARRTASDRQRPLLAPALPDGASVQPSPA